MSVTFPIKYPLNYSLGNSKTQGFPKIQYAKIIEMIDAINALDAGTITITDVELGDGTAALPSLTFAANLNTGLYRIGSNNIGISLGGTKYVDLAANLASFTGVISASTSVLAPLFDTATAVAMTIGTTATSLTITPATTITGALTTTGGLITDSITEKTAGKGITLSKNIIRKTTLAALNSTGTVTAAMINNGGITSTSAAGVTATLDTVANIVSQTGAVAGTIIEFIVDNTGGANAVTVALPSGITAAKQVSSGDTAVDTLLVVTNGAATGLGVFRLVFTSTSAATIVRIV